MRAYNYPENAGLTRAIVAFAKKPGKFADSGKKVAQMPGFHRYQTQLLTIFSMTAFTGACKISASTRSEVGTEIGCRNHCQKMWPGRAP